MSELSFTAFIVSLASTAAIHLGDLADPQTGQQLEPNLEGAAQMIEILTLLEEKTRGNLTAEERQVLEQRFGLVDGYSRTLEEVGRQFQVTRERIRQIEAKALRKMRHPTRIRQLEGFLEAPGL